ncbi:MYG1 protein [Planococcus citri]|uniref:MYG1 protein n=1 Tax=Planococcus citri TaxID=170843 RepID=UPI0031F8ABC1
MRCIIKTLPNFCGSRTFKLSYHHYFHSSRKMSDFASKCVIGTHDGVFHCDEALGCFLLKTLYPHATIVRSRNQEILNTCDIVIDVGGEYNPEKFRFDHHQRSFNHSMSTLSSIVKTTVKLSSAGLIYHHFGRKIIEKIVQSNDGKLIDYVYKRVYGNFIQEIDGTDNGLPPYPKEPLYNICTHVSARVQHLLKPWNVKDEDYDVEEHFQKAMNLVGGEFIESLESAAFVVYPARAIVEKAIENRFNVHPSGKIIELEQHCPWKDHFFDIEKELNLSSDITYVLFQSDDNYRVMCVSVTNKSFVCRKFLPPSWRGLRNDALSEKSGIPGCVFAHHNGFIGGNETREGALQMAVKSLENEEES